MIDLYTWGTPNGQKISIALEEMGLAYRVHPIDISAGDQFHPEFLNISPNNKIPAIQNEGQSLFESVAILTYLSKKSGQFLPPENTHRYWEVFQWLMWQTSGFGPMLGQAHHFLHFNPGESEYAGRRYSEESHRLYGVLDKQLSQSTYVIDELSIADFAIWPWVACFEFHKVDLKKFPHVLRWYEALAERPGFIRGYAQPKEKVIPQIL